MVTQRPLEALFLVRVQAGQPRKSDLVADAKGHRDCSVYARMKFARTAIAIIALSVITTLAFVTGCGKKGQIKRYVRGATPTPTPTPHVYKLWEPRPITLNADKPLIVPAATAIPEPTRKR